MQGLDDDDWEDDFRPTPHPDDRLWRHPAEIAAEARAAAMASADTVEIPTLLPPRPVEARSRRRLAAVAALSALLVGTTALVAGSLTRPDDTASPSAAESGSLSMSPPRSNAPQPAIAQSLSTSPAIAVTGNNAVQPIIAMPPSQHRAQDLSAQLYVEIAASLPKVQVVTNAGMSEGSGFFLTPRGHIATSARLLRDAEYVIVWTEGNRRFQAEIVGSDMFSDVALLKIEAESWPAADVAEQSTLHLGQGILTLDHQVDAMVLGEVASPFGILQSDGHPSAPRVLISDATRAGSAIIDDTGAIVAMSNGLTDRPTGHSIATPAWLIERVALDMLVSGNSSHAWFGAEIAENASGAGVTITEIVDRSPAHLGGLQVGDRIERIDGTTIDSLEAAMRAIYSLNPSDEVGLMVVRADSRRILPITMGSLFD